MLLKSVAGPKLLTLVFCSAISGKTRSAPACGATLPCQFWKSDQRLVEPAPVQVKTAGRQRSSRQSISRRRDWFRRKPLRVLEWKKFFFPLRNQLKNMSRDPAWNEGTHPHRADARRLRKSPARRRGRTAFIPFSCRPATSGTPTGNAYSTRHGPESRAGAKSRGDVGIPIPYRLIPCRAL